MPNIGRSYAGRAQDDVYELVVQQIRELYQHHATLNTDKVASYYPPEMEAEGHRFGLAFTHVYGRRFQYGDADYAFPMQSIAKVFIYAMALEDNGRKAVLEKVGVEPSGDPYNSLTFDEQDNRPYNPMINSGALVTTRLVRGESRDEKVERIVGKLRIYANNPNLHVDEELLAKEMGSNDRNMGISYIMRSLGMIDGDLVENINVYLSICSVRVTAKDLATMGATLAFGGINPFSGMRALPQARVRDVITVMSTCGMYNAAGEWAYDVGIPAKSGVSGAILIVIPSFFGGAIFSPGLDSDGNSVRGISICQELSSRFGLHTYADPDEATFGLMETAYPPFQQSSS